MHHPKPIFPTNAATRKAWQTLRFPHSTKDQGRRYRWRGRKEGRKQRREEEPSYPSWFLSFKSPLKSPYRHSIPFLAFWSAMGLYSRGVHHHHHHHHPLVLMGFSSFPPFFVIFRSPVTLPHGLFVSGYSTEQVGLWGRRRGFMVSCCVGSTLPKTKS